MDVRQDNSYLYNASRRVMIRSGQPPSAPDRGTLAGPFRVRFPSCWLRCFVTPPSVPASHGVSLRGATRRSPCKTFAQPLTGLGRASTHQGWMAPVEAGHASPPAPWRMPRPESFKPRPEVVAEAHTSRRGEKDSVAMMAKEKQEQILPRRFRAPESLSAYNNGSVLETWHRG
ncbi:hypothetical protein LX36DRAFT_659956 [Colletotrichum falcatum]|nr:hypothetical protein LX36DRAFT_659956 [Colletotrichum falcatum]